MSTQTTDVQADAVALAETAMALADKAGAKDVDGLVRGIIALTGAIVDLAAQSNNIPAVIQLAKDSLDKWVVLLEQTEERST